MVRSDTTVACLAFRVVGLALLIHIINLKVLAKVVERRVFSAQSSDNTYIIIYLLYLKLKLEKILWVLINL